ncbi:uncharacterized protein MELLADRAFT_76356 [Melampsora larici-populina 98AG31]|uniref:Uncharacterized protein n=1 Tax=Melampsora larici-populina (strain 98AG31 / pathotype 3-4-7) TaxID=747676 RepID=F4R4G5_MELLP|nr:uncharacterized protein MELLADRAFT_76356 [Melampsora larici-populina 98AG31]EGG13004.1 hypothetical protein MELLADRAFT_76356 [Melampsora larici-populina 98AG31]
MDVNVDENENEKKKSIKIKNQIYKFQNQINKTKNRNLTDTINPVDLSRRSTHSHHSTYQQQHQHHQQQRQRRHHRTKSTPEEGFEVSYKEWAQRVKATRESIDQADQEEQQKLRKEILTARQARRSRQLSIASTQPEAEIFDSSQETTIGSRSNTPFTSFKEPTSKQNSSLFRIDLTNRIHHIKTHPTLGQSPERPNQRGLHILQGLNQMSDNFQSNPKSAVNSYSRHPSDLSQSNLPNKNHAIQYSSKFSHNDDKKPIALAHFMGARKDLNGPVLTKQRVDEKEVRPEGWELAEKRHEIWSKSSSGGVNSLANFLGGGSSASHVLNPSKRALPGMVSQHKVEDEGPGRDNQQPVSMGNSNTEKFKQRSLPMPPNHSTASSMPVTSANQSTFLKPKSLADRLAQLGVVNDVQHAKPHLASPNPNQGSTSLSTSPMAEKFMDRHKPSPSIDNEKDAYTDKLPKAGPHHVIKSKSTYNLRSTAPSDDIDTKKSPRPASSLFPATKPGAPTFSDNITVQPEPITVKIETTRPTSIRSNTTQAVPTIANHKNSKSQSYHVPPHVSDEQTNNNSGLSAPNKVLTASLSRLAGSNIVAQRLQWSKRKEQTGGLVDEFGSSGKTSSPRLPSSQLFTNNQSSMNITPLSDTSNHVAAPKRHTILFERANQVKEDPERHVSPLKPLTESRFRHSETKSVQSDLPPTPTTPTAKNVNQYNKSNRDSSGEDDELQGENPHDLKRNKQEFEMPHTPASPVKSIATDSKTPTTLNKYGLGVSSGSPLPSMTSSPLKHLTKNRARGPQRSGSRTISQPKSPVPNRRAALTKALPEVPGSHKSTLPSIPSFAPVVKKGTSELAAAWENQLQKKAQDVRPASLIQTSTRPLPAPPTSMKSTTGSNMGSRFALPGLTETDSPPALGNTRPLPVPPNAAATTASAVSPIAKNQDFQTVLPPTTLKRQKRKRIVVKPTSKLTPLNSKAISLACQNRSNDEFRLSTITKLEIFQLHKADDTEEFSTTLVEPEEYNTFYSDESLLIFCNLSDGKHILFVWKGKRVTRNEAEEEMIGRLLKKYGIDQKSRLLKIQQGYEPVELIEALGGSLMIRLGDRFELFENCSTVFSCRSYQSGKLLVIEESILDSESVNEALCAGYSALIKVHDQINGKMKLFQWNGSQSDRYERLQCSLVAQQVLKESSEFQPKLVELEQGGESDEFRDLFGEDEYAISYHWKYKSQVGPTPLILQLTSPNNQNITLKATDNFSTHLISVIHTGLEVFVIVPASQRSERSMIGRAMEVGSKINEQISQKKLAVNCLVFPTLIPVDLRASIRFSYDLERLNEGFVPEKMNLLSLDEAFEGLEKVNTVNYLEGSENQEANDDDDEFKYLPIGIGPNEVIIETI